MEKRWDGCIQLHRPEIYTSPTNFVNRIRKIDHWEWLQKDHGEGKRIFTYPYDPRIPNSVEYPLEGVLSLTPYHYLRSSPAEALALGIYLGYTTIGLWGAELTSNTEYAYQSPNMAFWVGFAHGRGVDFQLHCWKSEFDQRIYGVEGELSMPPSYFAERMVDLERAWHENEKAFARAKDRLNAAMLDRNPIEVGNQMIVGLDRARLAGATFGALEEARRYAGRDDIIPRQEFEYSAAKAQEDGAPLEPEAHKMAGRSEYVWNVWKQTWNMEALNQLRKFTADQFNTMYKLGRYEGIYKENIQYIGEYDTRVIASGGVRALEAVARAA
jgi:hypothetical protein